MKIFGDFSTSDVDDPPEEIRKTNLLHAVMPAAAIIGGWAGLYVYLIGFIIAQIVQLFKDSRLVAVVDTIKDSVITGVSAATVFLVFSGSWPLWIWQGWAGMLILVAILYAVDRLKD